MALYTLEEFASKVQSDVDTATATLLQELVTGLIADFVGSTFDPDAAPATVKAIALSAAARDYTNPNGITSTTRAIDDFNRTDRYEGNSGSLYLTDEERAMLLRLYGTGTPRNRSVVLQLP